jgi:hypothetical protein
METEPQAFNAAAVQEQIKESFGSAHPEFGQMAKDAVIAELYREAGI